MIVWIFNHYASSDYVDKGGRHYWISANLKKKGLKPVVFCCNKVHNSDRFCFNNNNLMNESIDNKTGVPFVFLRGRDYNGNGIQRVLNMLDYYWNLRRIAGEYAKNHGKPDIIYASSVHPLALIAGIQIAKKFGVRCVCEMRDLWPESIVAIGMASKNNPLIKALYWMEKWILKKCDALITTFEGGYDYIIEKGYTKIVPKEKYYYINNGIDINEFDENVKNNVLSDEDLDNNNTFKVIYTGSLRIANGIEQLLGCAKELIDYKGIQFLVYGRGESDNQLKEIIKKEGLNNVHLKGAVEKKYIPYILSKGNVNMLNYNATVSALYKYGSSQNKLFEYLASGRPIISNTEISYDIIKKYNCGISSKTNLDDKAYASALLSLVNADDNSYRMMCVNARKAAYDFDFKKHTDKLLKVFQDTINKI